MEGIQGSPVVSVAIINYNGRAFADELLASLERQNLREFETLFIDNASTDGSAGYVRDNYPWVRVLEQETNLGFARAGNLAARQARSSYLALLNPDIKLDPGWLRALVEAAGREERTAAVASKILLYDRPHLLNGVGGCMNFVGYAWDRGMFEEDRGQYDQPEEVLFASAGAALFCRPSFLEAGGFDERFFMYHEDVDLCWRLWLLGYRVITAPQAVAYHHFGGATRRARGLEWREVIGERNCMRSLLKNYEPRNVGRAFLRLLLLRLPLARKRAQIRNLLWNLAHLAETWKRRRKVQRARVRTDSELERLIVQSSHVPIRL